MKKLLIISLFFFMTALIAQDGGEPGPGNPGTVPEFRKGPRQPKLKAQSSINLLEGGLFHISNPFSPDGTKLITVKGVVIGWGVQLSKPTINIWDIPNENLLATFEIEGNPSLIAWHPNSKMVIAGTQSNTVLYKL